jgi:hypothetical protein
MTHSSNRARRGKQPGQERNVLTKTKTSKLQKNQTFEKISGNHDDESYPPSSLRNHYRNGKKPETDPTYSCIQQMAHILHVALLAYSDQSTSEARLLRKTVPKKLVNYQRRLGDCEIDEFHPINECIIEARTKNFTRLFEKTYVVPDWEVKCSGNAEAYAYVVGSSEARCQQDTLKCDLERDEAHCELELADDATCSDPVVTVTLHVLCCD